MRKVEELFALGLPFGTKYLRAFYLLLVLTALVLAASAAETGGGVG